MSINRCIDVAFENSENVSMRRTNSTSPPPTARRPRFHSYDNHHNTSPFQAFSKQQPPFPSFNKSLDEIEFTTVLKDVEDNEDDDINSVLSDDDSFAADYGRGFSDHESTASNSDLEELLLQDAGQAGRLLS
uniref:Uncharacterized protein n=1 Tax=Grammatophora oceanica TaxID=210454 RepID=A0A7S1Y171_9STRA